MEIAATLTPRTRAALAALEARVVAADGGRLKLEWDTLDRLVDEPGVPPPLALQWDGDTLVGFAGRYAFGGNETAEIAGAVDPAQRRRGIGTALVDAVLGGCSGYRTVLLVAPRNDAGGAAFATARGAALEHSEHALVLAGPPRPAPAYPGVVLRDAGPEDLGAVGDQLEHAFGWRPELVAERMAREGARTLLVLLDGTAIGTIRLTDRDGRGTVSGFGIDPAWRGRGIGRDVLTRCCSDLRARGASVIGLEVLVDNDHALGLYTSVGFEPTLTEDYYALPRA